MPEKSFDEWNKKCLNKKEKIKEKSDFIFSLFILLGLFLLVGSLFLFEISPYIFYFSLVSLLVLFVLSIIFKSMQLSKQCDKSKFED